MLLTVLGVCRYISTMHRRERQGSRPYTATQAGALGLFEGVHDVGSSAWKFLGRLTAVILCVLVLALSFAVLMKAAGLGHVVIPIVLAGALLVGLRRGLHRAIVGLVVFQAPPPCLLWVVNGFSSAVPSLRAAQAVVWPVRGLERPPRRLGAA